MDKESEEIKELKSVFSSLLASTDEAERSNFCKDFVEIISSTPKDEKRSVFSGAAEIFVTDKNEDASYCLFLNCICKEILRLDVLSLIAEIATHSSGWIWYCAYDPADGTDEIGCFDELMSASYCKDLLVAAGNDKCRLMSVIEIFLEVPFNSNVAAVFPELLASVKLQWQEEELIYGLMLLLIELSECDDFEKSNLLDILGTTSVLLSLTFARDPTLLDVERKYHCPRNSLVGHEPLPYLFVRAFYALIRLERQEVNQTIVNVDKLKAMRHVVPVISKIIEQLSEKNDNEKVLDSDIFQKAITIQLHFIMNVKSEADIAMEPNDLKLIITSKVMVKILDVYQYHECSTGKGFCQGGSGCSSREKCKLYSAMVGSCISVINTDWEQLIEFADKELKRDVVALILSLLNNKKLFGKDGPDLTLAHTCLQVIGTFLSCGETWHDLATDFPKAIMEFLHRVPGSLCSVALVSRQIMGVTGEFVSEDLFDTLNALPSICINHLIAKRKFTLHDHSLVPLLDSLDRRNEKRIENVH